MSEKTFSRLNASILATLKPHGGRGGSGRLGGTHHSHSAHCLFNIFTGRSLGNRPKSLPPCGGAVEVGYFERCLFLGANASQAATRAYPRGRWRYGLLECCPTGLRRRRTPSASTLLSGC